MCFKKNLPNLLLAFLLFGATVSLHGQTTIRLKVATWNTSWLSCDQYNPSDDALQINNVASVIRALSPDLIALQEVGTSISFATIDTLVSRLGSGWAGAIVPSTNDNCGQNQGIIYRTSRIELTASSLITDGGSRYNWSSGRYPALYQVNVKVGTSLIPVSIINIHAKAMSDDTSYERRLGASQGLKALLDGAGYNTKNIIFLGDYNDYLIGTQNASYTNSPYKNFVDDNVNYLPLTSSLYDPYYNSPVIDNIIISNELINNYVANSATRETAPTSGISNYRNTTSDHYPISATFSFTGSGDGGNDCMDIYYSQTMLENLGDFTTHSVVGSDTWTSSSSFGAVMTGYVGGTRYENESWLISPSFDLSDKSSATLSFQHAINYATTETLNGFHTLLVSSDYSSGDPTEATWTEIPIPTMPNGTSWTFANSGNIVLPAAMLATNVHFAFKYLSTSTVASTWEIKNLVFEAECLTSDQPATLDTASAKVFSRDGKIYIESPKQTTVTLFDTMGRVLFHVTDVKDFSINIGQSGVYLLRVGNETHKVALK